ncbi:ADP-ribosyltransferase [Nocardiopsis sp. CC223A]|uniref:ADP-ribosyltransferase n=1 Tax=Nocardiopsis sp. CC223A TaxID=3044051 RepID=UPI00278C37CF|nr:ADP-ribosyltransferase [Nocardiopsis sp. CC223A]
MGGAVASGDRDTAVTEAVRALREADTARDARDEMVRQAGIAERESAAATAALDRARSIADLSSPGSAARTDLGTRTAPPSDPADAGGSTADARTRADAAVHTAQAASRAALSLPLDSVRLHVREARESAERAVRNADALVTDARRQQEEAAAAAGNARSALGRTRAAGDRAGANTARDEAATAAGRAEGLARAARSALTDARAALAAASGRYDTVLDSARADADVVRRIAALAPGSTVAAETAYRTRTAVRAAEARMEADVERLERAEEDLHRAEEAVNRIEALAAEARRSADGAREQAEHPRVYPGTVRKDESADTYDLDYLVRSRIIGPDRLYTERVPEVVGHLITAQAPDMPAALHANVASQIDHIAREHGMAVFFSPEGVDVTVTDGTGDGARTWTVRVALESAEPNGYRHLALPHREAGAPLESREEERSHSTKTSGTSSHDPRRGISGRFTASPLLLGDVTGSFAAGPWLTAGGGYARGQRGASFGGNEKVGSDLEYTTFSPPEVYLGDLRVRVKVTEDTGTADGEPDTGTAPGGAPPADPDDGFQSGVVQSGVALVLAGEVKARPDGTPARIDLTADRTGGDGAHARTPDRPIGALPISVTSVTPRGDGAGGHRELGSWLAEYLVSRDYAPHREAMDSPVMRLARKSTEARIREWQAEIRAFFNNDSVQEYLPFLGSEPMTVSVTHPVLGEVMLRLSSTPDRYTAKAHTPLIDDATLKHTVETGTALGLSRNSGFTATVGGGFGVLIPLSTGGSIRLNMPHLEYTYWRSLSSQAESGSEAGHNRSLARYVSGTETFTAFDSESTLSVRVQGETTAHTFDARAVELLPGEGSAALRRAASGENEPGGADAGRTPPLPHLRGTRVTDFSGTHHDTLTRIPRETAAAAPGEAPGGTAPRDTAAADDRGVLEEITDRVLAGIAREHPGLVIPELARDQRTYARRPGRENAPYFERSFREHWGLRRDYRTAYQNTIDVANTVRDAMHGANRDRLASSEGLTVVLRETASIDPTLMVKNPEFLRPDVLTLSLKADFSGLSHQGTTTAETGLRTGGESTLAAESGRGSSHTLALSAGSGMVRSAESDARGLARLLGGFMASLGLSRLNHGEAAHGVSHSSNQRFIFPGGSDRWGGTVDFTARLHTQDPSLSGRPDGGADLLGEPVRARYSLIAPKDTAGVPLRGGEAKPAGDLPFTAQDARALIDPRPEDLAAPDPADADGRRARAVIENGATVERVSLAVPGGDATRSSGGVLRRAFDAFTDRRPVSDGRRGKLRGFLDTVGGRHFFTDFLSPVSLATDPATFSPSGHRGRVDLGGTWRSPNDMRATGATSVQPERIVDMHAVKAQVAVAGDTTSTASAGELKLTSATLGATGFAGGTGNPIEEGGAASGADRSTADGIVPMAGPSHNWNFFRRGEITDSGVSSASGLFLLSKAATVYTFRMAGTISQAWEFKKHRGLNLPNWWSHKYAGWKTRVDDLVSGHITARDAEQAGIITDAVTHGDDGTPAPATQDNPAPPPHARVRTGFDGAGQQRRPADPTAAVRELEVRLRGQGLKLTRGGRERLLAHLTRRLGNAPGVLPPVPVKVVRAAGTSRFLHRSKPARVLVELDRTNPRVDYVTSAVATVETHSWQTESAQAQSRGTGHTSGAAFTPWQPSGENGGSGRPPESHLAYASPAAGATAARSTTETDSSAEEETHTVVMESSGPYARVTHDTSLTLTLETGGRPPVRAQADSGTVQTFHLGSSLDFTPPATPAAALDTAPAPPAATPRAGDTLAAAVTTATEALGDPALAPRIRDSVIMPTAVHGPDLRDTAVRTVAASLGWQPPAAPDFGDDPTAEQLGELREHHRKATDDARRHIADHLELDPRYTPIDNSLNPVALKGLFSRTVGRSAGVDILRIGRTRWRAAATPDFTGARILTARPDARLVHKEAEGQALSHSRSQGGTTTATAAFRPTGHHTVDPDNSDRTAFLTGSGDAAARTTRGSSATANGLVTGEPSDLERQRLGTAYLVEFDTTWTIGARTENKTPFGKGVQQFTADHTNKTSAWISQADAIALGIITPEQATAADAPITAEHNAAKAMADAEASYVEERAKLPALVDAYLDAHAAHTADPTPENRTALDAARTAYQTQDTAYRTALDTYNNAVTAWTTATNATRTHLDGLTRSDAPPPPPPGPPTGTPLSDRMERELGARPAAASLLDTFRSALNTQPPPGTGDEITVFLMEQADQDPAEGDGHLPEPTWTREQETEMAGFLGLEDPAARAAELDDPGVNPHTFDALPRDQREAVAAQADTGWLASLTWIPSLDTASIQSRLEDLTYDADDNASGDDLNGWPLYERNGNRWPTLTEIRESHSRGGLTHTFNRLVSDIFKAPDPGRRLRHWYDNADEAGALAKANGGAYPTAAEVLDTLRTLDAATDRPLPGPVEVTFALNGDEGLHGLDGYVEGDPSSLVGTEQREAGYLRTSLDRSPDAGGDRDGTALVRLTVPEGGRGLWVGDRAGTSDPYTLLLPRGTGYRVTGVTESDGIVEITAVALPAEPRPPAAPAEETAAVRDGEDRPDGEDDDRSSVASDSSDTDSEADTDGRGTLDEDGIRRFASPGDIDGQDRWLQDPANNPHAFDTLTPGQRKMVDTYTRSAWITRVARIRPFLPQTVARQLMEWRSQSRAEAADPDTAQTAHGWDLYEANGLTWPSVERLRQIAASPQPLPSRTRGLIRYILGAPDPRAELDHWFHNAGYAGVIARLNGGTYPDAAGTRELFRLLDSAVDHPLPEGMAVSRGMQTIDHLLRTTGGTDPRRLVGTVHTEPGYMSTTLGDQAFKTDTDGFPYLLRLDLPQGTRGLWIGTRSHDPEQMELTLARGTSYRITGVEDRIDPESGGPQTVVTATVVPLPRAFPDLFSEGSTGEDGVRRFWNTEEAHWYGHRLHDPAHNPHAVNALPRARHDLARALSALAGRFDPAPTDPDGARELLDSLRAASRVTPASTPAERQRILGWELYEANGLTWPTPDRLLQLLPVEQGRNPARARFITDILRHGPQEAARRLERLYNTAGDAGTLARANGGAYPSPERLLDMLASYEGAVRRPLPEAVETTWYLDHATARAQLPGYDPHDPSALAGTEQATRGYTAVALNPRPTGRGDGAAAVVRLVLPAGAHGLWLGNAGTHPQNQEIVLPPGTAFRIDSVDTSDGRPVITARVHAPTGGTAPPAVASAPPAVASAPPASAGAAAHGTNDAATGPDTPRTGHGPGDGRGYVDGNGIRRFRTEEELDAYDRWLHDPAHNPHAFDALSPEHRDRIIGYTVDGWLNTVARDSMNAERVATVLDLMRRDTVAAFETNPMGSRGWELYEMNDLAWPTLDRLRELLAQGRVPERAEGFVRYILDAPDPQEELDHWYVHAGEAGEIARSSGDVFPTPERALEHLRILAEAIDRPLPEGIEVIRGLEELGHFEGFDGRDPYSLVGTVHTERGFMSTSLGNEPAGVTARYAHTVHLVLPRGSRGIWIGSKSRYPGERELILPPGTTYRITRAGWGGSRGLEGLYIEAEVIVPPRPGADPAPPRVEDSADLHVFTAETETDATVTGPDEPDAEAEAGLAALLGVADSGHDGGSEDGAYDDRPLLDRYDSDDDRPLLERWDDSDDEAPAAPAAGPEAGGEGVRGFRTREEMDAYAERMEDPAAHPHTYDALPPKLRALVGAHTANPWLSDLARLGTSDPAVVQSRLDDWGRTSLGNADDPDDPNGWVLYEANGLSWPSLGRVRELYAGGGHSPAFGVIAADIFRSSDPRLRLDHWYGKAGQAGAVARADGGVYPTGDRVLEIIRDMDAAVDRPLPGPIEVSFALDVDRDLTELDGYDWEDLSAMVGRDQRARGYTTATLGGSPFTTEPRDTVAVVRMVLPEDARGLWVGDRGATGDRYALVLPRDFGYRITGVRITADGMEIDAEPVPARTPVEGPSAQVRDGDSDASTVVDEESRLPEGDGRGHVGDDGYRRFRSPEELDAYDLWLQDPAGNPHAFDTLPADQRRMVDAYTRSAWITRLARIRPLSPTGVAGQLALVRAGARHEAGQAATVATAHGWDLYEANGLTWPTLDRLREIRANPDGLPPRTVGLIDNILTARDPAAELRHWFHNAGYAGVIARRNGGTYPDVDRVLELFRLLDDATGRPVPEGLVVSRGMHSIDHLLHAVGGYDADDLEGTVHTEPGYMSTTLGDQAFKTDAAPFRYLLRLNVPQGAHGLWIGSRSHDPEQRELTLARGSTYRITGVRETVDPNAGGIVTVLSAEVVLAPEAFADPLSDGRVDASGVRRFRTPGEADWYAHRAARAERGMPTPDTLPARARRVARAFSDTPWLADLALVPPGDVRTQLDRLRSMSRTERPSIVEPHGSSGWELYEANGLSWPTAERLREIVDAAEEETPRTHFLRMVLTLGSPEERLAGLYRRSGMAGALAAANGGTYPSAEGVRELLGTYDAAVGRPLPEAIETTWVLTHTRDLRFPEGYDAADPSALVGTVQSSPGYTTVSANPDPVGLGHPAATVRLTLPEGAHGLWLGADGPRPSNHEIVLPRGMSYRVTGAENTSRGLLLSAEAVLPERVVRTGSGARPPTAEDAPPPTGGTGQDTAAPGEATGHTATSADASAAETGIPVGTAPADGGRGYVDDRGVRRFRSVEEADAYGRWLHEPANNPHAFDTLDARQRDDVRGYTTDGWLNKVVRDDLSAEQIQDSLDRVRRSTLLQADTDPMAARGWSLYELNGLSWPTVGRLRELLAQDRVPEHTAGFVRYILDAPDPESELAGWYANAGNAGTVARSNGGAYPTAAEVTALLDRLGRTVDRPLPETVEMVRGLHEVSFLDGFRDLDPYSLVGTVQTEPGFMSVSLGNRLAGHHQAESRHVVHLTVPAGARGLWVGERSEHPEEREVVLARGTAYRITRAGWGGSFGLPGFYIEAEVVVPPRPGTGTDPAPPEADADGARTPLPEDRSGHTGPDGVRRFETDADGQAYGDLVLGHRFPSLTDEQQNSARAYTKNAQFYNDFSRHGDPEAEVRRLSSAPFFTSWVQKWFGHTATPDNAAETLAVLREAMSLLDRAMEPVPERIEVRRSAFSVGFMAPPGRPYTDPTDLIGTEFVERGFLSGSLGSETVNRTAEFQFRLDVPAGHPALWVGDNSVHRSEREVILPRGTRFRIDDAVLDPETRRWTLRVTVPPFTPTP